ncbi:MAG: GIY-YIG nuclease family protein [Cyanobacterium sp. T60_A2020_053]|nr:GIY-YIG nuclease family protein [Cyanobacterium sp. T60_A2020_053]
MQTSLFKTYFTDLPYVSFDDLNFLPHCSGIYFAYDSKNIIHYIGQAKNIQQRWKTHHRKYQLEEINQKYPVKIAWLMWSEDDLDLAEKYFIDLYKPLLNNTKVISPNLIPSEITFKILLSKIAKKIYLIGQKKSTQNSLTTIYLKYDATNTTAKGAAAVIKNFKKENKDKYLKIKWQKYNTITSGIINRIGSREHRQQGKENRAYNNHWQIFCNGVVIDITPQRGIYQLDFLETKCMPYRLAGIKTRAILENNFLEMINHPHYCSIVRGLDSICPLEINLDPIPLLWKNWQKS